MYRLFCDRRPSDDGGVPRGGSPSGSESWEHLVRFRKNVVFGPVDRSQVPQPALVGVGPATMPRFLEGQYLTLYTEKALRKLEQGVVDESFTIDGDGHAHDLEQNYANAPDLGANIPRMLSLGRFKVPSDWAATGSQKLRFVMEFQFAISNLKEHVECPKEHAPPRIENAAVTVICHDISR